MAFDFGGPSTEPQKDKITLTIEELMKDGWSRELAAAETLGDNKDKVKEYFEKNKRFINMETLVKIIAIMPESFANVWKEVLKENNYEFPEN